jgi:hypothetical protein
MDRARLCQANRERRDKRGDDDRKKHSSSFRIQENPKWLPKK